MRVTVFVLGALLIWAAWPVQEAESLGLGIVVGEPTGVSFKQWTTRSTAVAGGAASIDSVDISKHYLQWGKRNFALNNIDLAGHRFFCSDVFDFYKRARRQGRRYHVIVLDPPTFSRSRRPKRVFELTKQLDNLLIGAVELLEPAGLIFLATNCREIDRQRMEQACITAAGQRQCTIVAQPQLPLDFAGDPECSKSIIVKYG